MIPAQDTTTPRPTDKRRGLLIVGGAFAALIATAELIKRLPHDTASPPAVTASARPTGQEAGVTYPSSQHRAAAKELVKQRLRDPGSAEFTDIQVFAGSGRRPMVCGRVNARNGFGGMTGAQRFIVGGIVVLETEVGEGGMDELWSKSCFGA